jgi:hypothetical protein
MPDARRMTTYGSDQTEDGDRNQAEVAEDEEPDVTHGRH